MTPKNTNQPQATIDERSGASDSKKSAERATATGSTSDEVHVASLREALEKVYAAGLVASRRATSRTKSR